MKKTIFKYWFNKNNRILKCRMPQGAKILHGDHQSGVLCIWAEVDPSKDEETRHVIFVGTGHDVPPNFSHVNSFLMNEGALVFHLYVTGQ